MKTFDDIKFETIEINYLPGIKGRLMFENGYGISVIKHKFSYGGEKGLFEIAVLDSTGELTYETPITNDVIGNLTAEKVSDYMRKIQNLKNINCENDNDLNNISSKIINIFTNSDDLILKELLEKRYVIYDEWNDSYKFKKIAVQEIDG